MKIIANTYLPCEMDGFSYAFIDLDPALTKLLFERRDSLRAAQKADPSKTLLSMEYQDYSAVFLCGVPEGTPLPTTDDGGDYDETDLTLENLKDYTERTDGNRMVVTGDGVHWTVYPHYSDRSVTVETNEIDYADVEEIAAQG